MAENMNQAALDEISALVGHADEVVAYGGGGKGQTAYIEGIGTPTDDAPLGIIEGKGSSRYAALVDLLEKVRAWALSMEMARIQAEMDAEAREHILDEEKRATVDDALSVLMLVFPNILVSEEDDDRPPAPVWKDVDGVPVLVGIVPCVGECMQGSSDICDCRCMGANHGLMKVGALGTPTWAEVLALKPVRFGPKACACGCGTQTDRRFAPGHDARFHAAQKREQERASLGMTEGEYVAFLVERGRAKAKARRAARRAKRAAVVMPSEATDS